MSFDFDINMFFSLNNFENFMVVSRGSCNIYMFTKSDDIRLALSFRLWSVFKIY